MHFAYSSRIYYCIRADIKIKCFNDARYNKYTKNIGGPGPPVKILGGWDGPPVLIPIYDIYAQTHLVPTTRCSNVQLIPLPHHPGNYMLMKINYLMT